MPTAPIAEKISHITEIMGNKLQDDYAWMQDANWPTEVKDEKILSYLKAENEYSASFFDKHQDLKTQIFEELKGRIELKDQSPYVKRDNYYYYTRIEPDNNYPIICRKNGSPDAPEEILLDVNKLAIGKSFVSVGAVSVSPDHNLLAYGVDFLGNEKYTIKILDLKQNEYLPDEIPNTSGSIVWHNTQPLFFYTPVNEDMRRDKVMMHKLGSQEKDIVIFHETSPLYFVGINQSNSKQYMFIGVGGFEDDEYFYLDLSSDNFKPQMVLPRLNKVHYSVNHHGEHFYILTNDMGDNFRLQRMRIGTAATEIEEYILMHQDKYLSSFDVTKNYLILNYKEKGLSNIIIRSFENNNEKTIAFPEEAFAAEGNSTNFEEDDIRIGYSSLGRPDTTYSYDFLTDKLSILKSKIIPSGFNPDEYKVERVWADNNGTSVPISLFYKKSLFKGDGSNPLYLYGYGSYGIAVSPVFRNSAVSLADRGFVFAIAHIRGGDDLGHGWYTAAKFLTKKRTFEDFIACTEYLITTKYTKAGNVVICGGSAGGMLIGAAINTRPELYKAAIAHVPFVDVLNTMLNEDLPLTPGEFKEWGNPKESEYFSYIKSYSPYDNILKQDYPHLFLTAGISDPRVGYWEAAKFAAKLRANKTDNNLVLLKTNMDSGHQGASGRFDYLKEAAEDYVFIFKIFNIKN
ncbi:MAG: S9 family peptidase [Pseudomonadota bacterium]